MIGPVARAEILEAALRQIVMVCNRPTFNRDSVKPPAVRGEISAVAREALDRAGEA